MDNYSNIIKETSGYVDKAHAMGNAIENRMKFYTKEAMEYMDLRPNPITIDSMERGAKCVRANSYRWKHTPHIIQTETYPAHNTD